MAGYGSLAAVMNAMETAIAGRDYVCGDKFTAADVYFSAQVTWGMQFGSIEKRPAFEAYSARITARPAYLRATQIDDAAMAQVQAHTPG